MLNTRLGALPDTDVKMPLGMVTGSVAVTSVMRSSQWGRTATSMLEVGRQGVEARSCTRVRVLTDTLSAVSWVCARFQRPWVRGASPAADDGRWTMDDGV